MSSMSSVTMLIGLVLTLYGAYSYAIAEKSSVTALIPAFFGLALIGLGALAILDKYRKHAMHAAAAVALIGFLGGAFMGFPKLGRLLSGDIADPSELNKARSTNLLALTCLIFVIMCVNSFIQARKARQAGVDPSTQPPK